MSRKEVLRVSHFSNSSGESLLIFCTTGSKVSCSCGVPGTSVTESSKLADTGFGEVTMGEEALDFIGVVAFEGEGFS